ncbi:hypothetical protein [Ferrimicrobium acidiphilum]|uniref:hypothetical protein n=1 Tax=Ferrimicrobium acidiphilum TaxID=121039 RepID=UPI0023F18F2B|nr:hypothetical protein [Ferrimicrobium acidiphilum]
MTNEIPGLPTPAHPFITSISGLSPTYENDYGCAPIQEGSTQPWECRASTVASNGYHAYIRVGVFNGGSDGSWGWEKAYKFHNMDLQAEINVIHDGASATQGSWYTYELEFAFDGQNQFIAKVVVATTSTAKNSGPSPDGYQVGLYTGYCTNPSSTVKMPTCPNEVNTYFE